MMKQSRFVNNFRVLKFKLIVFCTFLQFCNSSVYKNNEPTKTRSISSSTGPITKNCYVGDDPEIPIKYIVKQTDQTENEVIKQKIEELRLLCGDLCNTYDSLVPKAADQYEKSNLDIAKSVKYIDQIRKKVECDVIWTNHTMNEPSKQCFPPRSISNFLESYFTYNGNIEIQYAYYNGMSSSSNDRETEKFWRINGKYGIKAQLRMLEQNVLQGSYGTPVIMRMKKLIQKWMPMKNSHVLVVGSKLPWIEVLLLSLHVEKITTLDYNPFNSDHPRINTVSPMEMSTLVSNQREPMFDGMISFSSLEHSGLGRYGDELNPWADVITMARAWCLTKQGGRAIIGVPTGKDKICFNGNKFYGKILYKHLFANWDQLYSEIDVDMLSHNVDCVDYNALNYQPMTVLERPFM